MIQALNPKEVVSYRKTMQDPPTQRHLVHRVYVRQRMAREKREAGSAGSLLVEEIAVEVTRITECTDGGG